MATQAGYLADIDDVGSSAKGRFSAFKVYSSGVCSGLAIRSDLEIDWLTSWDRGSADAKSWWARGLEEWDGDS